MPEARISSDTDVCISPDDEEKAMSFFESRLVGDYPCLNRFPWLLPFVWFHRVLFKGFAKGKKTKEEIIYNENDISAESKRRVEMFRFLGIL